MDTAEIVKSEKIEEESINQAKSLDLLETVAKDETDYIDLSFGSEDNTVVRKWKDKTYLEILKYDEQAIDTSRLVDGGLALLLDHSLKTEDQVGRVEDIVIDPLEKKLRGKAKFLTSQKALDIVAGIKANIIKSVSFGYCYKSSDISFTTANDGTLIGTILKWCPTEVSIVPVPEDVTVGFNKAIDITDTVPEVVKTEIENKKELIVQQNTVTDVVTDNNPNFKKENKMDKENIDISVPTPKVFGAKNLEAYSIVRHIKGLMDGNLTGCEREVAQELGSVSIIPTEAMIIHNNKAMNMDTATGGADFNIPGFGSYLDILLPQSIFGKLGVQTINLAAPITLPGADTPDPASVSRSTGSGATATDPVTRSITYSPKVAVSSFPISRTALNETTPGMENYLKSIMLRKHAADFEKKALAQILGEITNSVAVLHDTTKHTISDSQTKLQELSQKVTSAIDLPLSSAYVMRWDMYDLLKTVLRSATLNQAVNIDNKVYDMPAYATALLDQISSTYSPVIFGDWSQATLASFGNGVNIVVDPYTNAIKDQVNITSQAHWDAHVTNTAAFAKIVDATAA